MGGGGEAPASSIQEASLHPPCHRLQSIFVFCGSAIVCQRQSSLGQWRSFDIAYVQYMRAHLKTRAAFSQKHQILQSQYGLYSCKKTNKRYKLK